MNALVGIEREISPAFEAKPRFTLNPSGLAPLAGEIVFQTSVPTVAEITVSDGSREWPVPTEATFRWDHRYTVLGMRSDRPHRLRVRGPVDGT